MQIQESKIYAKKGEIENSGEEKDLRILTTFTGECAKHIKHYGKDLGITQNAAIVRSIVHRYFKDVQTT